MKKTPPYSRSRPPVDEPEAAPPATATLVVRRVPAIMVVAVVAGAARGGLGLLLSYYPPQGAGAPKDVQVPAGRTVEIQRLIGRSLRGIVNLKALPEKSLWVDCDVLAADGGTRTLSVTGAYVAIFDAMLYLEEKRQLPKWPLKTAVAAVSVGILNGERPPRLINPEAWERYVARFARVFGYAPGRQA